MTRENMILTRETVISNDETMILNNERNTMPFDSSSAQTTRINRVRAGFDLFAGANPAIRHSSVHSRVERRMYAALVRVLTNNSLKSGLFRTNIILIGKR